jgi:hypothetical protein
MLGMFTLEESCCNVFFSLHTLFNIRCRRSPNMDSFATFSFTFSLLIGAFLSVFCLFYQRIRTLRYLRWLPSTEPKPQYSTQRPSDDNLSAAERGQAINSLQVDAERAPPVRTLSSERSGESQPVDESLVSNSGPAWR